MSDFVESEFIGKKPRKLDGRKARRKHFKVVQVDAKPPAEVLALSGEELRALAAEGNEPAKLELARRKGKWSVKGNRSVSRKAFAPGMKARSRIVAMGDRVFRQDD